jgi:hypothetical protein
LSNRRAMSYQTMNLCRIQLIENPKGASCKDIEG